MAGILASGIHSAKATALKKINDFRGPHKSPELVWGLELSQSAMDAAKFYAANPAEIKGHGSKKERGEEVGENIYESEVGDGPTDKNDESTEIEYYRRAIEKWYSEQSTYDYDKPVVSHFSQLIWKASLKVGMGLEFFVGKNRENEEVLKVVVIGHFHPPGNILCSSGDKYTFFRENVLKIK